MKRIKRSGRLSLLAVLLVASLLMTTSSYLAEVDPNWDKSSLCFTSDNDQKIDIQGQYLQINKIVDVSADYEGNVPTSFSVDIYDSDSDAYETTLSISEGTNNTSFNQPGEWMFEEQPCGAAIAYDPGSQQFEISQSASIITATVKNGDDSEAMAGSTAYEVWWAASGNPKDGIIVDSGSIPALESGETYDLTYDVADNPNGSAGNYMFKAYQRPGHNGTGVLWSGQISVNVKDSTAIPVTITNTYDNDPITHTLTIEKVVVGAYDGQAFQFAVKSTGENSLWAPIYLNDGESDSTSGLTGLKYVKEVVANGADSITYEVNGITVTPDDDGFVQVDLTNQDVTVKVTNYFGQQPYGKLYIKKIINGDDPEEEYTVRLCPYGELQAYALAGDGQPGDGCISLNIEKGVNTFNYEDYEFDGLYSIYEDGPVTDEHQGYLVFLSDSDWDYDSDSPIAGEGVDGFDVPDESTPVDLDDPNSDVYLVIVNYFEGDTPSDEPRLIVEKSITGNATQREFTVQLQKWECASPESDFARVADLSLECGWQTVETFNLLRTNNDWTLNLKDIISEYGSGDYRIIENTQGITRLVSVNYALDGENTGEDFAAFYLGREIENDIKVVITNRFSSSSSSGGGSSTSYTPPAEPEEPVIVLEPEPQIPAPIVPEIIAVPEPTPQLPKTGAAPMAAGMGLILAAGGFAIRRIKK
ncbi:hypothetical protein ASZ90_020210 [hydrocarbon metagenome]|uniref:Uncharacterized protein n=1 Tax=hydrocarbon metagenome TaxID=938273 RepID=A0A0W8E185_9ZZZZ